MFFTTFTTIATTQYSLNIMEVDGAEDQDCQLMAMSELSYVERVREIQKKKYPESSAAKLRKTRK